MSTAIPADDDSLSTASRAASVAFMCSGGLGEDVPVVSARSLVALFELVPQADADCTEVHGPERAAVAHRRLDEILAERSARAREDGDDALAHDVEVIRDSWATFAPALARRQEQREDEGGGERRLSIWEEMRAPAGPGRALTGRQALISVAAGLVLLVLIVVGAVVYGLITGTL